LEVWAMASLKFSHQLEYSILSKICDVIKFYYAIDMIYQ
jgi:hypothetical protein